MAEEEKVETQKSGGGPLDNKIILLVAIIVTQAVMAIALTQFVIAPKLKSLTGAAGGEQTQAAVSHPEQGVLVGLNEVVVTLRDSGPTTSYLRIDIDLEVTDAKVATMIEQRLPHLRDIVILSLSNKFSADLKSMDGKAALKAELFRKIAETLPEGSLMNVYFSDMVVQ
ncbi:flagellar basal body-associated FliL family protein [bacterium]|nr:flagellar basal body-associated FliL family protein [bacterium]